MCDAATKTLQSRPAGNKVIVAGRAVRSSARYRRSRFNQVLEVGGCLSIDGLMDKQAVITSVIV